MLNVYQSMKKALTKRLIQGSFAVPEIAPYKIGKIIHKCFAKKSNALQSSVRRSIQWLSDTIQDNGELSQADYERLV